MDSFPPKEATWENLVNLEDKVIADGEGDDTTINEERDSHEESRKNYELDRVYNQVHYLEEQILRS